MNDDNNNDSKNKSESVLPNSRNFLFFIIHNISFLLFDYGLVKYFKSKKIIVC
jgi:hypothetical protein